MRNGKILVKGRTEALYTHPQTEYMEQLIAAAPDLTRAIAERRQG
jgi:ABC-type microcin C transport system duplicated ATPase subunit YejF